MSMQMNMRGAAASAPSRASGVANGSAATAGPASTRSSTSANPSPPLRTQLSTDLRALALDQDDDFERLLASYDVPAAIDALRRYLALEVQSNVLGAASKQQSAQVRRAFYERFNQILDRIFGNDETSKHKYGGWLDSSIGVASSVLASRRKRASAAAAGVTSAEQDAERVMESMLDTLTPSGRALTEFLGFFKEEDAGGSIFQLLFKTQHPVEFKLEMDLLPEQSKMSLLNRSAFTSVLFTQLLHKPMMKQHIDPREPVLLVSIKELFLFYFMRHPASATHQTSAVTSEASSSTENRTRPSSLIGSISDSLSRPNKLKAEYNSWRSFFKDGVLSLTKGNPYNVLLLQYLRVFFPDSSKPVQSRFHGKVLHDSNLFLHILIEFWLRQNLIVFSDHSVSAMAMPQKLASPFGTVHTQTTYMAPSDDLLSSLLLTIIHLLADSFYPVAIDATPSSSGFYSNAVAGGGGGYLTPSISVLRRPIYEFFRLVFSRAPIGLSPTAFFAITDVWLAYIQPWCCKTWVLGQTPQPKRTTPASDTTIDTPGNESAYSPAWESYVLANYHFYTTLLGCFIERAKELDFTGNDERGLTVLDRVLNVYTPELLSLLRDAADSLDKHQPFTVPLSSTRLQHQTSSMDPASGFSPMSTQVLTFYCKALGLECVAVPLHASYHRDAERVFDKLWTDSGFTASDSTQQSGNGSSASRRLVRASSSSWFSQPGESALDRVQRLSRQLRRVFEISDAYVASTAHARSPVPSQGLASLEPSRHSTLTHLLTLRGLKQLRQGLRKCSPDEARFVGDPMLRPICSYEIGFLVRWLCRVSFWLNQRLELDAPYHGKHFEDNTYVDLIQARLRFRFNLRFLASKPNLAFLAAFLALFYVLLL